MARADVERYLEAAPVLVHVALDHVDAEIVGGVQPLERVAGPVRNGQHAHGCLT